jgi:hypothetical protein
MIFRRTVRFKREFKALSSDIQQIARAKFALFSSNWRHPSLRCHKLEGVTWHGHQVFDLWVTDRYRVLFVIDHDVIVSFSIGPHGIVSK